MMAPSSFIPEGEPQKAEVLLDELLCVRSFQLPGRSLLSTKAGSKEKRSILHQLELTIMAAKASCRAELMRLKEPLLVIVVRSSEILAY
jgi:hypothetical protein